MYTLSAFMVAVYILAPLVLLGCLSGLFVRDLLRERAVSKRLSRELRHVRYTN